MEDVGFDDETGLVFESEMQPRRHGVVSYDSRVSDEGTNLAEIENLNTFGQPTTLYDFPDFEYWNIAQAFAKDLPPNYRHRRFIVMWANNGGDVVNCAKACDLTRWQGRKAVERFNTLMRKKNLIK